jgi:isoleucyl-tRNA synthetase
MVIYVEEASDNFDERERKILRFWKERDIFAQSLKQREKSPHFTFYDGPPFATGLPHYGHLLAGTIKDVVPRYKTMKGYYVSRRFGWDCHGLPIEQEIEKSHNLSGAPSIESFGIGKFNEECRKIVLRYTEEWKKTVERMGRWVDFSQTWKTMDITFMESVWWVFKQLYDKGLVYEGYKVMPFSAKLGTPLSNFEASENYKTVDDPSVVIELELQNEPTTALLVWTTTPWTLLSNLAATVGPEIDYVKVAGPHGKKLILAKEAIPRWFKEGAEILEEFKGSSLVGKKYKPLFPHFAHLDAFKVIGGDFVTLEDGTGIVHTAPAFGEADFFAAKSAGIPLVCPVDNNGKFTSEIPEFQGTFVKDADKAIIKRLKGEGKVFYQGTLSHRYPFCWRSDTPLIYKAISTWFVQVEAIKDKILNANSKIHWMPEHLKEGRFGKWLEGARDWAISRNRYWGTPIPLWRSEDGEIHVVGSIEELEKLTNAKIKDLHRHFIDDLTFTKNGKTFKRISEVFDCWFDAGSMPYGQNHYPFENKKMVEETHPADFIGEGIDQTRGWFYTLTILSAALFDQPAFKNVVVNGILLAEDGNKMSKRLKNYPEPDLMFHKYGADSVRLYMLNSPAVKGDDLRFSEKGVELVLRQVLIPFWNATHFFLTYSKIYHWKPEKKRQKPKAILDQWILSQLNRLIHEVEEGMDRYDLARAVDPFVSFIDQLTNWYIRRSRRRFWADQDTSDRREAFETLHHVLLELCKVAAPFIPFLSEAIYAQVVPSGAKESVHLCDYPEYHPEERNEALEKGMDALQVAVSLGHALRKENKLKVRQPLPAAHIVTQDRNILEFLKKEQHLIADELNVKRVELHGTRREFVKLAVKPNFRILGKKVGPKMKEITFAIGNLTQEEMEILNEGKSLTLMLGDEKFLLTQEDVEIKQIAHEGWIAMNAGALTVALETQLDEELILEGLAREIVNKINTMRRDAKFDVTDRVIVHLASTPLVEKALSRHEHYIKEEVLAIEIHHGKVSISSEWDLNGEPAAIGIERVKS